VSLEHEEIEGVLKIMSEVTPPHAPASSAIGAGSKAAVEKGEVMLRVSGVLLPIPHMLLYLAKGQIY
jgi:hypothetical protein